MRRRHQSITALAILGMLLAACGSDPGASEPLPTPATETPVEATTDPPGTPTTEIEREPQTDPSTDPQAVTPGFGSNDNRSDCYTAVLTNEADDDAALQRGTGCLLGTDRYGPLVWDILAPTEEGDPVLHRFQRDDDGVLIVHDYRFDSFGSGGVGAERCNDVVAGSFLPEGVDCTPVDHPGFPEADSRDPVPVAEVFDDVQYYGACGNEIVDVGGVTYYPVPAGQGAALAFTHPVPETPQGLLRVPSPEPGDDVGTFVVFDDGVARFESESGRVIWLTEDEVVYWFVCWTLDRHARSPDAPTW